jgi:hypothetical protein
MKFLPETPLFSATYEYKKGVEIGLPICVLCHLAKSIPRFLPRKTRAKGGVEPTEFVQKRVEIAPGERKLRNGKRLVCRPTNR